MIKVFWFNVDWKNIFDDFKNNILKTANKQTENNFFELQKIRDNLIKGSFVEKRIYKIPIQDHVGNITEVENIITNKTNFIIQNSSVGIILIDPPRALKNFLNNISKVANYRISIKKNYINLLDSIELLKKEFNSIKVIRAVCDNIQLSKDCTGKLTITGTKQILEQVAKYPDCKIKELEFIYKDDILGSGTCILNYSGYCKIENKINYKDVVNIIMKHIKAV